MSFLELILLFASLIVPIILIYCAITKKQKAVLLFVTFYVLLSILSILVPCEFDILNNLTEVMFFDFIKFFAIALFAIIAYICVLVPKTIRKTRYLFFIPILFILIVFCMKTSSLPYRIYSMAYRMSDFFEILGFAFLSIALSLKNNKNI